MKNPQSGFVALAAIVLIALGLVGGSYYFATRDKAYDFQPENSDDSATSEKDVERVADNHPESDEKNQVAFYVAGETLSVVIDDNVVQTLYLDDRGSFALTAGGSAGNGPAPFITDWDVNFDGQNDVGVLASTGYAGVNNFYDFYVFNLSTERLEKSATLLEISPTRIDPANRRITSTYKSGPGYVSETFQWNGSAYVRSEAVPVQ